MKNDKNDKNEVLLGYPMNMFLECAELIQPHYHLSLIPPHSDHGMFLC